MFDMVQFAIKYRELLNDLTGCQAMKLRDYELTEEEWQIAEQLSGILDVSTVFDDWLLLTLLLRFSSKQLFFSLDKLRTFQK
jgi:hypothetical protein